MEIVLHDDVAQFARLARPLFDADPVRHNLPVTTLDGLLRLGEPAATLLTLHEGASMVGALLRSPGRPAFVSAVPVRYAGAIAEVLGDVDPELPGVSGPAAEAEAVATAVGARRDAAVTVTVRLRLFALDVLAPPVGVPGAARQATTDDLDLLAAWRAAFAEDVGQTSSRTPRELAARALRLGSGQLLWEVDGVPVAHASARRPAAGISLIGPVYTPPEHRRHGFGAAVTAAASQWAIDAGARQVLLYTDLANPTSNALYPRIGYRPVHDELELSFR